MNNSFIKIALVGGLAYLAYQYWKSSTAETPENSGGGTVTLPKIEVDPIQTFENEYLAPPRYRQEMTENWKDTLSNYKQQLEAEIKGVKYNTINIL